TNRIHNPCRVEQVATGDSTRRDGHTYQFDAAVFRIDPHTRKFEMFAEGATNPWGIAFDPEGALFVSNCVTDHFWHIALGGYCEKVVGKFPPYTWPIGSIVEHKHQMAAYCGLVYFDSDA